MKPAQGIAALLALVPTMAHAGPLDATVAEGQLHGTTVVAAPAPVRAFLGVPFAAAPTGPLRWRAPQPAARWRGTRDATRFAARCMQLPLFADMAFRSPAPSEDCLYLNVWTPASARPGARLPVLFYLYGGGFQAGAADEKRYDGASLAARGIVVITANYRLGSFGFLAHPALTTEAPDHASGNQGLRDQGAALAWVRRNVSAFGGDPAHITIGGESAGSMSVSALMAAPTTRGLIAGAIGESGAFTAPTSLAPPGLAAAEAHGAAFAQALGATTLDQLRALPADRLLAQQAADKQGFGPIVDGAFLPEPVTVTFEQGREAHVPLLVGSNSQEGAASAIVGDGPATIASYRAGLARRFGDRAAAVEALFPAATDADVPAVATELASDGFLALSTWKWMDLHRATGAPVFYYRYARVRPPALAQPDAPRPLGAVHSAEIEYALGNLDVNPAYAWSADDRRVSATFEGYLEAFVKHGNPNAAGLPAWPAAGTGAAPERQVIDVVTTPGPVPEARYHSLEPLLAADAH